MLTQEIEFQLNPCGVELHEEASQLVTNINKLFNGLDKSEKRTAQTSNRQDGHKRRVMVQMTAPVTVCEHMIIRRLPIKTIRSYSDTDKPSQDQHGVMRRVTPTAMSQEVGDE